MKWKWTVGGREGEKGEGAAAEVACEERGGNGGPGVGGGLGEEGNVGHSKCFNRWA